MTKLDTNDLNALNHALSNIIGYLSDNSCGDPDCCGGPYYEREDYDDALLVIEKYGLTTAEDARP